MTLKTIELRDFRNISSLSLEASPSFNIIHGKNGSGKTSLLESIHFLCLGRSFKTSVLQNIIRQGTQGFSLSGRLKTENGIGFDITIDKKGSIKNKITINSTDIQSNAELVQLQPLQLINPDTFNLIDAGPLYRRQFMDWGLFHVEQSFYSYWKKFNRALKQRNAGLQKKLSPHTIRAWDHEFVSASESIAAMRKEYIGQLLPRFYLKLSELLQYQDLSLEYYQGWDETESLYNLLDVNFEKDRQLGYTQIGPQRADLQIRVVNRAGHHILSRGEQKLVVCALKLAQGELLKKRTGKHCIYLIDDLAAELDSDKRALVLQSLIKLKEQVFLSCVDLNSLSEMVDCKVKKFHLV